MNPYSEQHFIGFFGQLFHRLYLFATGSLSWKSLAADEVQLLVLSAIALSSVLVGAFLVLRRMTMLANSISHTILLGIVGAYLLTRGNLVASTAELPMSALLIAAIVMGLFTSFLTEFLIRKAKLQEDASTGLVFTSLFAIGIIAATLLTKSAHIGIEAVMGNVDGLHIDDCLFAMGILLFNAIVFFVFYKEFVLTTFDPVLAKMLGVSTVFFNYLLMVQVSATVVGAFKAVGVLMVLAFLTGPILTARLLTDDLKKMIGLAAVLGVLASLIGVALSRHMLTVHGMALSTGGLVVCVITAFFVVGACVRRWARWT